MSRTPLLRRSFLFRAGALGVAAGLRADTLLASEGGASDSPAPVPSFPYHDPERVQTVVAASHGNLAVVRELVLEQPALAKASWDWGFGDWETALGAAAHTGRREIAELLLAHGARPTLFSAAMLGDLGTVRAFLEADPGLYRLHGPHGIPLLSHARAGGEAAEPVVAWMLERFGEDDRVHRFPAGDDTDARYGGSYRFGTEPALTLVVGVGGRPPALLVGPGRLVSPLVEVEADVFHPAGAPAVRLRFVVEGGRTSALEVVDGPVRLRGERVVDGA